MATTLRVKEVLMNLEFNPAGVIVKATEAENQTPKEEFLELEMVDPDTIQKEASKLKQYNKTQESIAFMEAKNDPTARTGAGNFIAKAYRKTLLQ